MRVVDVDGVCPLFSRRLCDALFAQDFHFVSFYEQPIEPAQRSAAQRSASLVPF